MIHKIAIALLIATLSLPSEPELTRVTVYTAPSSAVCSTGCHPYEGIIAGRPEDAGKIAILYTIDMEMVGIFEIKDTGGRMIRSGQRIDVFRSSRARCSEWVKTYGDYMYVQIIEAEG